MIIIAPKSSIIARATKKIFKDIGTLDPRRDNTPIENAILNSIYVEQCMAVGDKRNFISCLIVPNFEALQDFLSSKTTFLHIMGPHGVVLHNLFGI